MTELFEKLNTKIDQIAENSQYKSGDNPEHENRDSSRKYTTKEIDSIEGQFEQEKGDSSRSWNRKTYGRMDSHSSSYAPWLVKLDFPCFNGEKTPPVGCAEQNNFLDFRTQSWRIV